MIAKIFVRIVFFLVLLIGIAIPAYTADIKGQIKLNDSWQPVIYLASINSPGNLNVASPDFIISKTLINPDGTFHFENIVLSEDPQFYRFYLVKSKFSGVEFNLLGDRNYVHFILDNLSNFIFYADVSSNLFEVTYLSGDTRNSELLEFHSVYFEKKKKYDANLSKAQREFLNLDIENYIRNFVDSCKYTMVGLFALYQIEEKETDFLRNSNFYFDFQTRLNAEYPNAKYSEKYNDLLLDLVGFRDLVCEIPGVLPKWKNVLLMVQSILLLLLLPLVIILFVQLKKRGAWNKIIKAKTGIEGLTFKEQEILELLALGKSNKEIAIKLFVELSTVKSHLSRIYKQLNVSGRKEAIDISRLNKK